MSDDEYMRAMEIQRANFEAQFGSLETMGFKDRSRKVRDEVKPAVDIEDDIEEFDSDDDVIQMSDAEEDAHSEDSEDSEEEDVVLSEESDSDSGPKVISLTTSFTPSQKITSKQEKNLLKNGRAPTLKEISAKELELLKLTKHQRTQNKEEEDDNLDNDLKLQRLLQESHILSHLLEYSGADVTMQTINYEDPTGKARKRALDLRIRAASAVNSNTNGLPKRLEKMPMGMRKGMIKAREGKIAKYEKDAKDAGIILSKVRKGELRDMSFGKGSTLSLDRLGVGKKQVIKMRDRGLQVHGVGRSTRNGIVIPQADIDRINKSTYKKR